VSDVRTPREADEELRAACRELEGFSPAHAGAAHHNLGEVRLRLGDLGGAEEAFRRALELGEDPLPGLALLRLAQGDIDGAATSIRRSLQAAAFDLFARGGCSPPRPSWAAGDAQLAMPPATSCRDRRSIPTSAIRAASDWSTDCSR
jgi:tetratricopeptide (TPR) repeat protein